MRYAILALWLMGCVAEVPGDFNAVDRYPDEIETAVTEWRATFGRTCDPAEPYAVVAAEPLYLALCGAQHSAPAYKGCHRIRSGKHWLVVREAWAHEERNTITHEAMHWLAHCSGERADADREHSVARIWSGVLARTNAALGLPRD